MNIEVLREAVAWVKQQEELARDRRAWDQTIWLRADDDGIIVADDRVEVPEHACGTTMCLAGKIVWDAGYRVYEPDSDPLDTWAMFYIADGDGASVRIEDVAAEVLGVRQHETEELFYAGNGASEIESEAKSLAHKYGHEL